MPRGESSRWQRLLRRATAPRVTAPLGCGSRRPGMAERFPFGFAAMNDNILYHALAARSGLRLFGKTPRSAPHGPIQALQREGPGERGSEEEPHHDVAGVG